MELPSSPFKDFDIHRLDKEYSPSQWNNRGMSSVDVLNAHVLKLLNGSNDAKTNAPFSTEISYGCSDNQKLDLLLPNSLPRDCPILVYIHGGYWQCLGREISCFAALPMYNAGCGFVAIGFDPAPTVSLQEMLKDIRSAVKYVLHLAKRRGSKGVYLCGHSSGAHLASMMLGVDWMTEALQCPSMIKGAILISGLYDLRPLVKTSENKFLQLPDEKSASDISPYKCLDNITKNCKSTKIIFAIGSCESPEFQRQTFEFHDTLKGRGVQVDKLMLKDEDQFTIVENLVDPEFELTKRIVALMKQ